MVRVLFLFLTRFHVNVARSNGDPIFSRRSAIALSFHNTTKSFSSAVDVFRFCLCWRAHYTWAKKQIKFKNLRIDGNPRKLKRVVICKNFFARVALRQSAAGLAKIFPPKINACVLSFASYVRREGHLYEVFLVFNTTRLI